MAVVTQTGMDLRRRALELVLAAVLASLAAIAPAAAATSPMQWVQSFWPTAKAAGITRQTYDAALAGFTPDPEVLKKAKTQMEFNTPIWSYMDMMVSDDRISEGKAALVKYADTLAKIEARYGVDRYIVAAVWGIESHYGAVLSNPKLVKNTIRSLATLAYAGGSRFSKYGRQQLVVALKIVQRGDISLASMSGSWAGAMGQTQFIPTTYSSFAVDFDGDGKRNIWTTPGDALASTANYLRASGWQTGHTWGYEVILPKSFSTKRVRPHSLADWEKLGVKRPDGKDFPRDGDRATLYLPAGSNGPAFLLLANFGVLKHYNNADSYALAVGHLADKLRGGGDFVTAWPPHDPPLSLDEKIKLQQLLTKRGYYTGDADGNVGSGSREAIRNYELAIGMTPDGVDSHKVLQALEAGK